MPLITHTPHDNRLSLYGKAEDRYTDPRSKITSTWGKPESTIIYTSNNKIKKITNHGGSPRQVICLATGEIYDSVVAAAKEHDVSPNTMTWRIANKRGFAYTEDRPKYKRVRNILTGAVYESRLEAEKHEGVTSECIKKHCIGAVKNPRFEYVKEKNK